MTVADEVVMYMVILLMLVKLHDSTAAETTNNKYLSLRDLPVDITVSPPTPQLMLVGTRLKISVDVTSADNSTCDGQHTSCDDPSVMMSVSCHRPMTVQVETVHQPASSNPANNTLTGLLLRLNQSVNLVVDALSVGRAVLVLEISIAFTNPDTQKKIDMNVDSGDDIRYSAVPDEVASSESAIRPHSTNANGDRQAILRSSPSRLLAVIEYHITVARHRRPIDDGFFWVVAAATLLNAFGLGCVTVYNDVKQELRKLQPSVLATLLCQFVVLPPVC